MNAPVPNAMEQLLAHYLRLEHQARAATTVETLGYSMVNDAQPLFAFRHAALVIAGKVRALTGISVVEPNAPTKTLIASGHFSRSADRGSTFLPVATFAGCGPGSADGRLRRLGRQQTVLWQQGRYRPLRR